MSRGDEFDWYLAWFSDAEFELLERTGLTESNRYEPGGLDDVVGEWLGRGLVPVPDQLSDELGRWVWEVGVIWEPGSIERASAAMGIRPGEWLRWIVLAEAHGRASP